MELEPKEIIEGMLKPFEWTTTDDRPFEDADGTHPNDDDFKCSWHEFLGHVEQMGENTWYYGIYSDEPNPRFYDIDEPGQYHFWSDDEIYPSSRDAAIFLCETLMKISYLHNRTWARNEGLERLRAGQSKEVETAMNAARQEKRAKAKEDNCSD